MKPLSPAVDMMRDWLLARLIRLPGLLSFNGAGALGAAAGRLLYRRGGREVRNARVNLAMCFPEKSDQEREQLVRDNLIETGRSFAHMLRIWTGRPRDWGETVDDNGFLEFGRELSQRGRGLIFTMPHLGNWELIAYLATRISPATALYRPPRLAMLDDLMREGRKRSGITPVPTDPGTQGAARDPPARRDRRDSARPGAQDRRGVGRGRPLFWPSGIDHDTDQSPCATPRVCRAVLRRGLRSRHASVSGALLRG